MISISVIAFLVLLEVIVVLLVLLGVVLWRLRKARGRDRIEYIDGAVAHPTPALYLESEVAKTRAHLEEATATADSDPQQTALGLRAALLEVEAELAQTPPEQRDVAYWQALATRLGEIVAATGYSVAVTAEAAAEPPPPPAPQPVYVTADEDANISGLVEQQAKTIDFLRNYIQELLDTHGHTPSPDPEVAGRFDELERNNKELSSCVAVLEDENSFLRDQIAALLQMDQ